MILSYLISLAILLIPFNDLPYLYGLFKEFSCEAAFYPLMIALPIFIFRNHFCFYVPRQWSWVFLICFLIAILISGAVNISNIVDSYFAGRSGISKYVLQLLVLFFGIAVSIMVFTLARNDILSLRGLRKLFTLSFLIAGSFCIFEVFYYLGIHWAGTFLEMVKPIIHTENVSWFGHIRSVTSEPSAFGFYAALVFPWLISYLFTEKRIWPYALLVLYLLFLVLLSLSRLAYGIILMESLLICYVIFRYQKISFGKTIIAATALVIIFISSLYLINIYQTSEESLYIVKQGLVASLASEENMSNITRYGTQIAALKMGLDFPLWGVGLGQFPFYMDRYLPPWTMVSWEIREYLHGIQIPRVHGVYARIVAEIGFVGLFFWLVFLFSLIFETWGKVKGKFGGPMDWLGVSLVINLVAIFTHGFAGGSFRTPAHWIIFGMAWAYCTQHSPASLDHLDLEKITKRRSVRTELV